MFKFTKSFMAVALAVASIGASAQTSANKADLFGQDLPSQSSTDNGATTAPAAAGANLGAASARRTINNAPQAGQGAAAAAARGLSPAGRGNGNGNGVRDDMARQALSDRQKAEKLPELSSAMACASAVQKT